MGNKSVLQPQATEARRAVVVNFDNVFHNSRRLREFAAANAFENVRNTMANGMKGFFGKILAPEEFIERMRKADKDDENFANLRAFSALSPLANSPKEHYSLMLAIEGRPVLAESAAKGDRKSIARLKQTLDNSQTRNLPEREAFAVFFQSFLSGRAYTKEANFMGMDALEMTCQYEPLMKLNEPIAGAYRHLSALQNSATIYFSTQGSPEFAGLICTAWEAWIGDVVPAARGKFNSIRTEGILDAQINGPFPINIPTDLGLLLAEDGSAKLFSNHQFRDRMLSIDDGDRIKHMQLAAERERLPYENIWLLDGSYNKRAFAALHESSFHNLVVVENNPARAWNYAEARRDGVPVVKMDGAPADASRLLTK